MQLDEIRTRIDSVDAEIARLYEERMELSGQVADTKRLSGQKVYDREREEKKLDTLSKAMHSDFNQKGVRDLFKQIMAISRKLQYKRLAEQRTHDTESFLPVDTLLTDHARIVFQGADGSYSQQAMRRFFGNDIENVHVATFKDCMGVLDEGGADYAVLPIENSTAGIVSEIYDLLDEYENYIVGEEILPIRHCLIGLPGADISQIKTVYAHPQALMQCGTFFAEHPQAGQVSMTNNAFAVQRVKEEQDASKAAIAGEAAAAMYGLAVLKEGIQSAGANSTRFIIVSNRKIYVRDAKKISISFEVPHVTGALYHILSHIIYNDLNMVKIESRPIEQRAFEYRFFVDFEGNLKDPAVRCALCGLREETTHLRILGNY